MIVHHTVMDQGKPWIQFVDLIEFLYFILLIVQIIMVEDYRPVVMIMVQLAIHYLIQSIHSFRIFVDQYHKHDIHYPMHLVILNDGK
jgi:hypothetical protein